MGIEFINKVIVISIILALAGLIVGGSYLGFNSGVAILVGAAWSCINLYFIKSLMQSALSSSSKSYFAVIILLGIKFPLLYGIGFVILKMGYLPVISLLLGFSLIFLVILAKGTQVWLMETKEPKPL